MKLTFNPEVFTPVHDKFLNGDGIADAELKLLLLFYKDLTDRMELLGREFTLSRNEIRNRYDLLKTFQRVRQERGQ